MARVGKRLCLEQESNDITESVKRLFDNRLSALENKLDLVITACSTILLHCENLVKRSEEHKPCSNILVPKIEALEELLLKFWEGRHNDLESKFKPFALIPSSISSTSAEAASNDKSKKTFANMEVIRLNDEEDLPNGCWLGDETVPEGRVRVNISPSVLLHINEQCTTPEKMALTLLDCLVPREIQSVSNLSGKGKHSKRRLDPLLIYGIHCHLVYKFNISDKDWHRIKQNIDSKCRSMWRKKIRGLPLISSKNGSTSSNVNLLSEDSSDGGQIQVQSNATFNKLRITDNIPPKILTLNDGKTVQVFTEDDFTELLPSSVELFSIEDNDCFGLDDKEDLNN